MLRNGNVDDAERAKGSRAARGRKKGPTMNSTMGDDPVVIAIVDILDRCIVDLEGYRQQQIDEFASQHPSSQRTVEDVLDVPNLRRTDEALKDLKIVREKVIRRETS